MSYIVTSGYGYSKKLCESVTSWFLNRFFPRHQIRVEILHRGLKSENSYGYCDITHQSYRPRDFLIELDTYMNEELYTRILLHELAHLAQWVNGSLRIKNGKLSYSKQLVENYDYWHQPHEKEARRQEHRLNQMWLRETRAVPVAKVAQGFPNRLRSAL